MYQFNFFNKIGLVVIVVNCIGCSTTETRTYQHENRSLVARGTIFEKRNIGVSSHKNKNTMLEIRTLDGKNSVTNKRVDEYLHGLYLFPVGNLKLRGEIAVANTDNAIIDSNISSTRNDIYDNNATSIGFSSHYAFDKFSLYFSSLFKETTNLEKYHKKYVSEIGLALNINPYILLRGGFQAENRKYSSGLNIEKEKPVLALYSVMSKNKKIGLGLIGDDYYLSVKSDLGCSFQRKINSVDIKNASLITSLGDSNQWFSLNVKWLKKKSSNEIDYNSETACNNLTTGSLDDASRGTLGHERWVQGHPVHASSIIP